MISRRSLFTLDFERPPQAADRLLRVHRTAMACRVEVTLAEHDARFMNAASAALNEADRVEALLTALRASSELSRVNREGADGAAQVNNELFTLLQRCLRFHADTDGAFDITTGPLSRCWGFLQRQGRVPSELEILEARELVGMSRVKLDAASRRVQFDRPGMQLNLGAIGKGHALDQMARVLRTHGVGHALVSAGFSSVLAVGGRRSGWTIDVRSPLVSRGRLARIRLRDGALGTSAPREQFAIADGTRYGHVIDPRTGQPVAGVLSASVVAADAEIADALSTAFFVGGVDLARRYCAEHSNTLAILTLDDGCDRPHLIGQYRGATVEE